MLWWEVIAGLLVIFILFSIIHHFENKKHPCSRALLSMALGVVSLLVVDLSSVVTGIYIPISLLSVFTSIAGGIPGVTMLLALNLIM